MVDRNAILAVSVLAVFVAVAGTLFAVGNESGADDVGSFASEPVTPRFSELPDTQSNQVVQHASDAKIITSSGGSGGDSCRSVYSTVADTYVEICD